MEIIMFKVPDGTKSKLRRINPNVSALLREQVNRLLERESAGNLTYSRYKQPGSSIPTSTSRFLCEMEFWILQFWILH
jgi:hypothetical protein